MDQAPAAEVAGPPRSASWWILVAVRSGVFHVAFNLHLAAMLIVTAPVLPFLSQRACFAIIRGWARRSEWLLAVLCGVCADYRGRENLPDGPFILAHKHQSQWETVAFCALLDRPCWIIKRELLYVPLFNLWALKTGMVFISRGARSVALEQLTEGTRRALAEGRPVVVAPEGTRRRPGEAPAYKYGIAHLYATLDAPIVPVALNSGHYWPWWGFLRFPGRIAVSILPAIQGGLGVEAFRARLEADIEGETERLRREAVATLPPRNAGR